MSDGRSNRTHAIRAAFAECDAMDAERKELSAQHRARKRLLISELEVSPGQFDVMRKLDKLERDDAIGAIRDAFLVLAPGETVNFLDTLPPPSEEEPGEYSAPAKRRGRPPGSKNKPRAATDAEIRADHAELAADDLPSVLPAWDGSTDDDDMMPG